MHTFWRRFTNWLAWHDRRYLRRKHFADLLAVLLLIWLMVGFFWRAVSGDVYQPADGGDLVSFLYPTYRFAANQLQQGILPLWNPTLYGGAPFISDIQAGFLYIPNLILFLLWPNFDYTAMQWLVIGHLTWAALGMYVFLRAWSDVAGWVRLSRTAALFGAIAFALSDPLLIHLGNLNLIAVLSWLPWVLAAYHKALYHHSLRWAAIAGFLFSFANYAGHAQSTFYMGMALALYTIGHWAFKFDEWRNGKAPEIHAHSDPMPGQSDSASATAETDTQLYSALNKNRSFWRGRHSGSHHNRSIDIRAMITLPRIIAIVQYPLITATLTILLTAPILLPAMELTRFTERNSFTYQDTVAYSMAPAQAIGLLTPGFFGRGPALHWSLWSRVETPYAGVATLILALWALVWTSPTNRRRLWVWVLLGGIGFTTALGIYALVHGWLTWLVPLFDQFRAPARSLVLWTFAIAVLGAVGVDALRRWPHVSTKSTENDGRAIDLVLRWGTIGLAGIAVPLLYLALFLTQENEIAFLRASIALLAISAAAAFWIASWVLIAIYRAAWLSSATVGLLFLALLFFDLSATGAYTDISPTPPTQTYEHPELVRFLREDETVGRVDTITEIQSLWQPDSAALYGLEDVGGIANPLMLDHWHQLWEALGGRGSRLYDMLHVTHVLVQDGTPLPEGKFVLEFDAPGALSLYRNINALPRAWLVHNVTTAATTADAFAYLTEEGFDPTVQAVVEGEVMAITQLAPASGEETVTVTDRNANQVSLVTNASAPALLLLSEIWFPGWRVTVNGESSTVLRTNGALRGVVVPAGTSQIELRFMPDSWRTGLLAAVAGWILMIFIFIFEKRVEAK